MGVIVNLVTDTDYDRSCLAAKFSTSPMKSVAIEAQSSNQIEVMSFLASSNQNPFIFKTCQPSLRQIIVSTTQFIGKPVMIMQFCGKGTQGCYAL